MIRMYIKPLQSLLFATVIMLVLLFALLAAFGGQKSALLQGANAAAACEMQVAQLRLPVDDRSGKNPRQLDSKPCKRIGKITREMEKPVTIMVIATAPTPVLPRTQAQAWAVLSLVPVEYLLLRRSGITRAPPAFV